MKFTIPTVVEPDLEHVFSATCRILGSPAWPVVAGPVTAAP